MPGEVDTPSRLRRCALGSAAISDRDAERGPLSVGRAIVAMARCVWVSGLLLWQRRIRQPSGNLGRRIVFGDGCSSTVYRETVIERPAPISPAVLVVCFRLRRIRRGGAHALFRLESELNTVLFAGFPGLVSKLWLRHDQHGTYRGIYQWDDPELAVSYVRTLWWVLALVSHRSSIHYAVLPGLERDEFLADPLVIDQRLDAAPGGWWRPTTTKWSSTSRSSI